MINEVWAALAAQSQWRSTAKVMQGVAEFVEGLPAVARYGIAAADFLDGGRIAYGLRYGVQLVATGVESARLGLAEHKEG